MPKMKTKRGAAKRFKVRGSGSIKRARRLQAPHPHQEDHQAQAPAARRRSAVDRTNTAAIRSMLPYSS